jgi:hypothetical protein
MRLDGVERSLYGHAAFYKDPVRPRDKDDKRPEINFPSTSMASLSSKSEDLLAINYGNDGSRSGSWLRHSRQEQLERLALAETQE